MTAVGFIGLGAMGRGMAANLQKAGHDLVVSDLSKEAASECLDRGATWAETPRELAALVDVVFTSLPTPADIESVGLGPDGLVSGLRAETVWFDVSTNSVDVVRRLHSVLGEQSVHFLDAPVSGGPNGATTGRMAIWVGGNREVFDRSVPLLKDMSDDVRYLGEIGAGTIAKLVHNMASLGVNAVIAEVMSMGVKAGLEPAPLWDAIRRGAVGRARVFDGIGSRFLTGQMDPAIFQLRLAYKDAQLALQLGKEMGVPMALCSLTAQQMMEAMNRGWGSRDSHSFLLLQPERSNLPPFALSIDEVNDILNGDAGSQPKGHDR